MAVEHNISLTLVINVEQFHFRGGKKLVWDEYRRNLKETSWQ